MEGGRRLRSGALARLAGVSPDTLRLYERRGILPRPPRTPGGYREYPPEAVARLRVIRAAIGIGFSIDELARFLALRDRGGAPCRQVRDLAAAKLESLERHLEELGALRKRLRALVRGWDGALRGLPGGARAGLLDSLAARPPRRRERPCSSLSTRPFHKEKKS